MSVHLNEIDSCPLLPGRPGRRVGDEGQRVLEMQLYLEYWTHFVPYPPTPLPESERAGERFRVSLSNLDSLGTRNMTGGV